MMKKIGWALIFLGSNAVTAILVMQMAMDYNLSNQVTNYQLYSQALERGSITYELSQLYLQRFWLHQTDFEWYQQLYQRFLIGVALVLLFGIVLVIISWVKTKKKLAAGEGA